MNKLSGKESVIVHTFSYWIFEMISRSRRVEASLPVKRLNYFDRFLEKRQLRFNDSANDRVKRPYTFYENREVDLFRIIFARDIEVSIFNLHPIYTLVVIQYLFVVLVARLPPFVATLLFSNARAIFSRFR